MFTTDDLVKKIRLKQLDIAYRNPKLDVDMVKKLYMALCDMSGVPQEKLDSLHEEYAYKLPLGGENLPRVDVLFADTWKEHNFINNLHSRKEKYDRDDFVIAVTLQTHKLNTKVNFSEIEDMVLNSFNQNNKLYIIKKCEVHHYSYVNEEQVDGWLIQNRRDLPNIAVLVTYMQTQETSEFQFWTLLLTDRLKNISENEILEIVKSIRTEVMAVKTFEKSAQELFLKEISASFKNEGDIY